MSDTDNIIVPLVQQPKEQFVKPSIEQLGKPPTDQNLLIFNKLNGSTIDLKKKEYLRSLKRVKLVHIN